MRSKEANKGMGMGLLIAALLVVALLVPSAPAYADTIYTATLGNAGGLACCTGPYATVDVHLVDATHATVTFDSLTNGGYLYLMAGQGAVAVNVNATSWTIGSFSASNSLGGFSSVLSNLSNGGAANEDGFGSFNQTVDNFDGFSHSWTHISFTLTDTSGTWGSSANVLTPNASGYSIAIHGFACAVTCSSTSSAAYTGYGVDGSAPVPEPASLLLLGSGLAGLGLWGWKRRKDV